MIPHAYPHDVTVTITEALGPVDRGAIYADPIHEALTTARRGEVTGGGTQLNADGSIAYVNVDVMLADLDDALEALRELVQQLGAPEGSVLSFSRDGVRTIQSIATGESATAPDAAQDEPHPAADGSAHAETDPDDNDPDDAAIEYDADEVRATAEKVRASYQSLMIDAYAYAPITRSAYDPSIFAWYDARTTEFEAQGFSSLSDVRIVKDAARPEPGAGPFMRRFVSRDGQHRSDIFQVQRPTDGAYVRVMNLITELTDGTFVWSCTTVQQWDIPPHLAITYLPSDITIPALVASHVERLTAYQHAHLDATIVPVRSLDESVASENRCQARTAAFRRAQQVPSVAELQRLGSEPRLAQLVHAELQRMIAPAPASGEAMRGEWNVTTIELPTTGAAPMSFDALIQFALDQGVTQVARAGSPLNPFLVYDTGRTHFFVCLSGEPDPMEIALKMLATDTEKPAACALVLDTRLTLKTGKKHDAIVAMASQRGEALGVTWAQAYRPKGFLRSFKVLPMREEVATSRSLFDATVAP